MAKSVDVGYSSLCSEILYILTNSFWEKVLLQSPFPKVSLFCSFSTRDLKT
jgi:hypothetical protein